MRQTLPKNERLSRKKLIKVLFEKGLSQKLYPIRLIYLPHPENSGTHQALFSVSKKNYKRAVDRNRLKRQMREAYRLNKHIITCNQELKVPFLLAYIYIGKEKLSYGQIEEKIIISLHRLLKS